MATSTFDEQIQGTLRSLRGAMTELVTSVGADPSRPQEIARRYRLNRNLSWKISKIIHADDPYDVVPHLPGPGGLERLLSAFETAAAPRNVIQRVRTAMESFERAVAEHAGERATFDLMLDSKTPATGNGAGLERCRKLAFLGNSGVWGVQCKVRLQSFFVAPSRTGDGRLDVASLGGFIDVRRLRSDVSVPLLTRLYSAEDGRAMKANWQPIESGSDDELMLLRRFCSADLPELRAVPVTDVLRYELPPGPIGNTALMTWVFGWIVRDTVSMYRDDQNSMAEHALFLSIPVESLMCDLFVHKDLPFAMPPCFALHGQLAGGAASYPAAPRDSDLVPLTEKVQGIGGRPPVTSTTLEPRYSGMVEYVFEQVGWDADDFDAFRLVMRYPPIPSVAVLRYDLLDRPAP